MKQLTEKNKKICKSIMLLIMFIIIIAGIIVTAVLGFNKELKYKQTQSIDVYVEKEFDLSKIKEIANQVFGKSNMIKVIEIYEDMFTVQAENITEEQKNDFLNKVKENYEFKQTIEDTTINTVPATRIRDMYKKYVIPFAISGILVLAYMIIRYYKKGILQVLVRTVCIPVFAEAVLLSIIAITRLPVGRFTPVFVLLVYIISIFFVIRQNEKSEDKIIEN